MIRSISDIVSKHEIPHGFLNKLLLKIHNEDLHGVVFLFMFLLPQFSLCRCVCIAWVVFAR